MIANLYYKWIKKGKITLDNVPDPWYEEVRKMLESEGT